ALPALCAAGAALALAGSAAGRPAKPPLTVHGAPLASSDTAPYLTRGTKVRASRLGVRTFVNARDGFALADVGQAQYPANTTDGGRTWRIDGPHFHVNAANAPNVVTGTGAARSRVYFAYAGPGGGQSVCTSTDGGKHWWRTYFHGEPVSLAYSGGRFITVVEVGAGRFAGYRSSDGGHTWHYTKFV
ncbi:MAG TPA: hypothetical protein VE992_01390, partial [Solirubrobacteraceae bacterium]|nr:hypothetical protein [Solirubrobacteraceae bacterium]